MSKPCVWMVAGCVTVGAAAVFAAGQVLPAPRPVVSPDLPATLSLNDLLRISLDANPTLRQAGLEIDVALGRATQAGLYPNPTLAVNGEELNHRGAPGGLITAPLITQEIVTGGKLRLSRAVALKEADQAILGLTRERFVLFTAVRQGYFEVLTAQARLTILDELVHVANQTYENTEKLLKAKEVARLDLLQFEIELNRYRADRDAARQELTAAWKRLAAAIGVPDLPCVPLLGTLEAPLPLFDFCQVREYVLQEHPEVLTARVGVERSELALKRAQVEPIPNVTVYGGYTRDNTAASNEWTFQVGVPVPIWNRNQGTIRARGAELGQANEEIHRVMNALSGRLATAFGQYEAARARGERYRTSIRPVAQESYDLAMRAYKGGQFEYLRVLQAQRALAEANLETNRALGDAWRAASEIAGLLLEENWPGKGANAKPAN